MKMIDTIPAKSIPWRSSLSPWSPSSPPKVKPSGRSMAATRAIRVSRVSSSLPSSSSIGISREVSLFLRKMRCADDR